MAYDSENLVLYVTGQVGPSSCYVGVLKQVAADGNQASSFQFLSKQVFDESVICQTLTLRYDQTGTALLLGTMEEGGLLTETRQAGSKKATQYGGMIELQFSPDGSTSQYRTDHSILLHQDVVQVPRSVSVDPQHTNRVFVATMTSESSDVSPSFSEQSVNALPNMTPGGGTIKYGRSFTMTIESIRLATESADADLQWRKPFGVSGDETRTGVLVNQILYHGDGLYVVGSTRGSGQAFGQATVRSDGGGGDNGSSSSSTSHYMAGFITKLNPRSGDVITVHRHAIQDNRTDTDTYIEAICGTTNNDDNVVYIVGSYTVSGRAVPFVAKLDASTLETVWQVKLPATTSSYALACGADSGLNAVYVAGVVKDGGELLGRTTTSLKDDVFVAQFSATDGAITWIKQFGTSGNDRLARGGTGLLVLGKKAGVLLLGDTTGNLYSKSSQSGEVFVVQVNAQGRVPQAIDATGSGSSQDQLAISRPVKVGSEDGGEGDTDAGDTTQEDTSSDDAISTSTGVSFYQIAAFVIAFVVILTGFVAVGYKVSKGKQEQITKRALVFSYLQGFDVEDVDVRHSATGGWHGTYVGKLAHGVNTRSGVKEDGEDCDGGPASGDASLLSSYSHSSVVKDSLFVDYDSTPAYGVNEDDENSQRYASEQGDAAVDEEFNLARLSYKDRIQNLDPWGKEIV